MIPWKARSIWENLQTRASQLFALPYLRIPAWNLSPPHYLGRAFLPVGNGVKKTLVTEVIARFITGSGAHLVRTGRNLVLSNLLFYIVNSASERKWCSLWWAFMRKNDRPRWAPIFLDLFCWWFFSFYHGIPSPFFTTIWYSMFYFFPGVLNTSKY